MDKPMPGDLVRVGFDPDFPLLHRGMVGMIEGTLGQECAEYRVCFWGTTKCLPSGFRGLGYVSCVGGPVPRVLARALNPTGETRTVTVWRFKDTRPLCREDYKVTVPVWSWPP